MKRSKQRYETGRTQVLQSAGGHQKPLKCNAANNITEDKAELYYRRRFYCSLSPRAPCSTYCWKDFCVQDLRGSFSDGGKRLYKNASRLMTKASGTVMEKAQQVCKLGGFVNSVLFLQY